MRSSNRSASPFPCRPASLRTRRRRPPPRPCESCWLRTVWPIRSWRSDFSPSGATRSRWPPMAARRSRRPRRGVRFDLVLMDVQMPEMDGFEATQKIRQFEHSAGRPRVPIVAMTAPRDEGGPGALLRGRHGRLHFQTGPRRGAVAHDLAVCPRRTSVVSAGRTAGRRGRRDLGAPARRPTSIGRLHWKTSAATPTCCERSPSPRSTNGRCFWTSFATPSNGTIRPRPVGWPTRSRTPSARWAPRTPTFWPTAWNRPAPPMKRPRFPFQRCSTPWASSPAN